jgi:glycosyltransferase involved in cell wall biosynthesis
VKRALPDRAPAEKSAADMLREQVEKVAASDLFSRSWYLAAYPDVAASGMDPARHYVLHGACERRDPGPFFSTEAYVHAVPELRASGENPLLHYLRSQETMAQAFVERDRSHMAWRGGLPYRNFAQYLRWATLGGMIRAPFTEFDKRCLAQMEQLTRWLADSAGNPSGRAKPVVSVIMPVRDRAQLVPAAIRSVLAQTYTHFELLVVDDGSVDDTVAVSRAFEDSRMRVFSLPAAQGVSAARNHALAQACGEWVAYLDSDNIWEPDYLAAMMGAVAKCSDADALYSAQYLLRHAHELPDAVRFVPYNKTLLRNRNYIDLNCLIHRRSLLDAMEEWFDPGLRRLVDWDFILKISERFEIRSVPILQSVYISGADEQRISKSQDPVAAAARVEENARRRAAGRAASEPAGGGKSAPLPVPVTVVVVSFQALESLRACLDSVARERAAAPNVEIVVADNNSSVEVFDFLAAQRSSGVIPIFNSKNYGFSYSVNQAVDMARPGNDIVILNNDAVLPDGAIRVMQSWAYRSPSIGIVAPAQIIPPGSDDIALHVPFADPSREADINLSAHYDNIDSMDIFHHGRHVDLNFAPFFCVYIKRDVWNACGGLDHEHGRHHRSDRIMCDFVRNVLKRRILYVPDVRVQHEGQRSSRDLRRDDPPDSAADMLQRNQWPPALRKALRLRAKRWDG